MPLVRNLCRRQVTDGNAAAGRAKRRLLSTWAATVEAGQIKGNPGVNSGLCTSH